MKTISYELSKRLNDLGLLDDIKTEYIWRNRKKGITGIDKPFIVDYKLYNTNLDYIDIKTLTLEEAIEFLPEYVIINNNYYSLMKMKHSYSLYCLDTNKYFQDNNNKFIILMGSQTEQIEGMIEYLLDNDLLGKQ